MNHADDSAQCELLLSKIENTEHSAIYGEKKSMHVIVRIRVEENVQSWIVRCSSICSTHKIFSDHRRMAALKRFETLEKFYVRNFMLENSAAFI